MQPSLRDAFIKPRFQTKKERDLKGSVLIYYLTQGDVLGLLIYLEKQQSDLRLENRSSWLLAKAHNYIVSSSTYNYHNTNSNTDY